jgi:hypothetical protein
MNRASRKNPDDGKISLFPFLAVLLCMMGSLLVLLIIVSQRAQATALEEQAANKPLEQAQDQQLADQLEKLKTHIGTLQQARSKLSNRMASDRQVLSHLEDHARRLRDDVQRLQAEARLLADSQNNQHQVAAQALAEAKRLEKLAVEAARLLAEAEKIGKRQTYSIVPYDGPHPTRRRPIYLECQPDAIVIQPEGIVLRESDFDEPLGPDNPLAVALRAASEYLARQSPDRSAGNPYPLLIVRPSSIRAYYAARAALQSWGEDFGYEMVDEDWKIQYIPPDPKLADVLESSVDLARRRMELQRGSGGGGGGFGGGGDSDSEKEEGQGRPSGPHSAQKGHGAVAGRQTQPAEGSGTAKPTNGSGRNPGVAGPRYPGSQGSGVPGGTSRDVHLGDGNQTENNSPNGGATAKTMARPGETFVPTAGSSASKQSGSAGGSEDMGSTTPSEGAQSLAKSRGKNWALPGASQGSVGVTRPLRIEVAADRIVIDSGNPGAARKEIPCTGPTDAVVEQFVSNVWDQMRGWGIAGRGMYWRPMLNFHVLPGGRTRAVELEALLDGSGLDVKMQP